MTKALALAPRAGNFDPGRRVFGPSKLSREQWSLNEDKRTRIVASSKAFALASGCDA
jgi:hypothetical protein